MTFGMRILTGEEWQVKTSRMCIDNFTMAAQTGAWVVDALPWLNHLPAPFTPWKKTAEEWFQTWDALHKTNLRDALKHEGWNWAKDIHNAKEAQDMTEESVAWNVGILCDVGIETTSGQLQILVLACLAHPEWIPDTQKELDKVVGGEQLPDFEDIKILPYIQAVVEENFRWRHCVPAGVPHATSQNDYYKGYLIPKGSIIVAIFNGMRYDESILNAPNEFRPERWLHKSQPNNFGYGRRVCPGRQIARNSLTIAIARLLWAFEIRAKDDEKLIVDESMFTDAFVSAPKGFEALFEPRSESHVRVIEASFEGLDKDVAWIFDEVRRRQELLDVTLRA
ncbi:cytochrome P450 [Clathrospora elynae]|uniref:Cytochrome P450 n=1 Tax=Clathrospora elynae TaxID=706981 RepID=A0A6A5S3C8_9PLEO|nr:cytochrome P450 [Clathrospora elynae]